MKRARERARVEEWQEDLAVAEEVERTVAPLDTVVDYTPLPLLWEYGGLGLRNGRPCSHSPLLISASTT